MKRKLLKIIARFRMRHMGNYGFIVIENSPDAVNQFLKDYFINDKYNHKPEILPVDLADIEYKNIGI